MRERWKKRSGAIPYSSQAMVPGSHLALTFSGLLPIMAASIALIGFLSGLALQCKGEQVLLEHGPPRRRPRHRQACFAPRSRSAMLARD